MTRTTTSATSWNRFSGRPRTPGLPRVVTVTYPENRPSQRVLEKLGFLPHGDVDYQGVRTTFYVLESPWTGRR